MPQPLLKPEFTFLNAGCPAKKENKIQILVAETKTEKSNKCFRNELEDCAASPAGSENKRCDSETTILTCFLF